MNREGRPLKFETVEILQTKIEEYFESCFELQWFDEEERDEGGAIITEVYETSDKRNRTRNKMKHIQKKVQIKPVTITGLAVALNTSRTTLLDYEYGNQESLTEEEVKQFSNTIRGAKDFIENALENGMLAGDINPKAAIFNAKNNFKWKDTSEIDLGNKDDKPFKYDKCTDKEIADDVEKRLTEIGQGNLGDREGEEEKTPGVLPSPQ